MFGALVVMSITQVIARYFFGYPLGWTDEAARFLLIWSVFLSVPILAARQGFLRVDALVSTLPEAAQRVVGLLVSLTGASFLLWVGWLGTRMMAVAANQTSTALNVPYSYIYLSLPVGFTLGALYLILAGIEPWFTGKKPLNRHPVNFGQ
jgi:C4-dicarboxylate transporter DctQ subunit